MSLKFVQFLFFILDLEPFKIIKDFVKKVINDSKRLKIFKENIDLLTRSITIFILHKFKIFKIINHFWLRIIKHFWQKIINGHKGLQIGENTMYEFSGHQVVQFANLEISSSAMCKFRINLSSFKNINDLSSFKNINDFLPRNYQQHSRAQTLGNKTMDGLKG